MGRSAFAKCLVACRVLTYLFIYEKRLAKKLETEKDRPERILSVPPKVAGLKKRTRIVRSRHAVAEVLLLGAIVIGGIVAITELRDLGAEFGVAWFGDHHSVYWDNLGTMR